MRKREILPEIQQISTNCSGIEEVVAEFASPAQHHGHPLAVGFLELRMGIDIDHLDVGAQFLADGPEGGQEIVTEVAPGAAEDYQSRPLLTCHRDP